MLAQLHKRLNVYIRDWLSSFSARNSCLDSSAQNRAESQSEIVQKF